MITDIKFGRAKGTEHYVMYVYRNASGNALIGGFYDPHYTFTELDILIKITHTLSHETLHKVLNKLEGARTCKALDTWCAARSWRDYDDSGMCF